MSSRPKYVPVFVAALVAGVGYWLGGQVGTPALHVVWKGSCVTLLALWAGLNARDRDGWWIAAVLALGAVGDVLLERSQIAGGAAFFAGHLTAAALYWTHRRPRRSPSQTVLALTLLVGTPLIAFLLPTDRAAAPSFALYALGLGTMAASAWASSFPRYRVGLGAVSFVVSDLLIFAKLGPLAASPWPGLLIWPTYLAAQALIAWGAVTTIIRWRENDDLHHRL